MAGLVRGGAGGVERRLPGRQERAHLGRKGGHRRRQVDDLVPGDDAHAGPFSVGEGGKLHRGTVCVASLATSSPPRHFRLRRLRGPSSARYQRTRWTSAAGRSPTWLACATSRAGGSPRGIGAAGTSTA